MKQRPSPELAGHTGYEFAQKQTRVVGSLSELGGAHRAERATGGRAALQPTGVACSGRIYCSNDSGCPTWVVEDGIHDKQAMREFMRIELAHEFVPDTAALLKFRLLLERPDLAYLLH